MTRNDDEADIIRYVNNITAYKRNVVLTAVLNLLAFVLKGHIRVAGKVFFVYAVRFARERTSHKEIFSAFLCGCVCHRGYAAPSRMSLELQKIFSLWGRRV